MINTDAPQQSPVYPPILIFKKKRKPMAVNMAGIIAKQKLASFRKKKGINVINPTITNINVRTLL